MEFVWSEVEAIAKAIQIYPHRVLVKSGHSVGKTNLAALLTNWHYDTFNPSTTITTAPNQVAVVDLLWKEVRMQRLRAGLPDDFIGPTAPFMKSSPDHYAKGITASKGESFQGRHDARMLFIFDEAIGIESAFWTTVGSMFKPEQGHMWLAICNPTDTSSPVYLQEMTGDWAVFELSCLKHPNVTEQLAGRPPIIPEAITVSQIDKWVKEFAIPVSDEELIATDIHWPRCPHPRGEHWRPSGEFESRVLGQWPSKGSSSVWTDGLWTVCVEMEAPAPPIDLLPELGIDCSRIGDGKDDTDFHLRWGCRSLFHNSTHGWTEEEICGYAIELAREWVERINVERTKIGKRPLNYKEMPIKVDDDGTGGAVCNLLIGQDMNAIPVRSGKNAMMVEFYPNKRSELWFQTVEKAKHGLVSFGNLDHETLYRLRNQAMMPKWKRNLQGRREVEDKKKTRDRLGGKSPDGMDAVNLAYYEGGAWEAPASLNVDRTEMPDKTGQRRVGPYESLANRPRARHGTSIGSRLFRR